MALNVRVSSKENVQFEVVEITGTERDRLLTLSEPCSEQLRRIDVEFRDLRREAGSRWHEGGVQLHEVRDLLGHANVSQTDTYLSAGIVGLQEAMKRFDASRGKAMAKSAPIEQRSLGHEVGEETPKEPLH